MPQEVVEMKKMVLVAMLATLLVLPLACNTLRNQPKFVEVGMQPPQLKPLDSGVISVKVVDPYQVIHHIEGVVREDPRLKFKLADTGQAPDVKAAGGIWTLPVDVPFQAPAGEYTVDLTAYRKDGLPVPVRKEEGGSGPMTSTFKIVITP
jgi:hypothetical protein